MITSSTIPTTGSPGRERRRREREWRERVDVRRARKRGGNKRGLVTMSRKEVKMVARERQKERRREGGRDKRREEREDKSVTCNNSTDINNICLSMRNYFMRAV